MTTPHIDDDQLQRYFDGELPTPEADQVRQALAESEEHQAKLEQLERLRSLVRLAAEDMGDEVGSSDDLYARVKSDLDAGQRRGAMRVIPGGRSSRVVAGTAVGLALAAAVGLALLRPGMGEPEPAPVAHEEIDTPTDQEVEVARKDTPSAPAAQQGSEVLEVDFGGNTGTVFEVEGSAGQPVAVVWINDEEQMQ